MNSINYISNTLHRRKSSQILSDNNNNTEIDNDIGIEDQNPKINNNNSTESFHITDINHKIVTNNPSSIKYNTTKIWYFVIFYLPKLFIFIPIYYIIFILLYPFIKFYHLIIKIFNYCYYHYFYDESDIYDYTESYSIENNNELSNENDLLNSSSSNINIDNDNNNNNNNNNNLSTYNSKNSIPTILEESLEFDPNENLNDDYFKSPLNSNPIIPQINLNIDQSEKNIDANTNNNNNNNNLNNLNNSINEKLLQATIESTPINSLKSSLSTIKSSQSNSSSLNNLTSKQLKKKKKKFIFPKLLFNFNIFDPPNLPKKTLILDLDETLIHSLSRYNSSTLNKNRGKSIEVKIMDNIPTLYHIYKRPYVEEFLSIVYQWFDLVCFTASIKEYADPVINYLEEQTLSNDIMKKSLRNTKKDLPNKIFKQRFYRNSCIFVDGKGYIKDLSVLINNNPIYSQGTPKSSSRSRSRSRSSSISSNISKSGLSSSANINIQQKPLDYSKLIIIDNSPISFTRHKDNGLMIEGWINDPDDTELMNLLPLLNSLRFVSDIRCVLGLKDGERAFT
jgi:CTD nuclear envelope phosphatase 1